MDSLEKESQQVKERGIKKVLASLDEVIDDINNPHLQRTTNKEELEKILNE